MALSKIGTNQLDSTATPTFAELDVDNVKVNGNTISATNTNGDISLSPNGTGDTTVSGRAVITGASTTTYDATAVGGQDTAGTLKIQNTANDANVFAGIDFNTNNDRVVNRIVSCHGGTTNDGFLAFVTEGSGTPAERLRVDASGNVGIGTTSMSNTLQVNGNGARLVNSAATDALHLFGFNGSNHASYSMYTASGNNNVKISTSETNFITQKLTIGATTTDGFLQVKGNNNADVLLTLFDTEGTGGTAVRFKVNGSTVGSISNNSSSTAFNTSSDHRLKEAVVDMTGAIDRVKALSPKRFNFIVDADTTVDGFLAHEAQAVVPEAVHGTHNEVDDDGNAVMQGIDQSKLVPLLTGALQEAIAKIETLETKVAALEAG